MKVKSEGEVTQSCLTLSDSMDCSLPGSSIHGIFQARVLEWGTIAFSATQSSTWQKEELSEDYNCAHVFLVIVCNKEHKMPRRTLQYNFYPLTELRR